MDHPSIMPKAQLEFISQRWPDACSTSPEEPLFLLAAGWRSGSTLLQRMLMRHCFMWGEPFGRAMPVDCMARQFHAFHQNWPMRDFFINHRPPGHPDFSKEWIANLYPPLTALVQAHLAYFHALFQTPAHERGFRRWGVKEVRLSIGHAFYLKWLFP